MVSSYPSIAMKRSRRIVFISISTSHRKSRKWGTRIYGKGFLPFNSNKQEPKEIE